MNSEPGPFDQYFAPGGDIAEGVRLARQASAAGDASADVLLALLSGMGVGAPQDWGQALDHLQRAAERGSTPARGQLGVLAGVGHGRSLGADHWSGLRRLVRVSDWLAVPSKAVLSAAPRAVAIEGLLSPAACDWLIGRAKGRTRRAQVYDNTTARARTIEGRGNTAFEFGFLDLDLVVLLVRARMAATIGVPPPLLEPPQVLHYSVGEVFARHYDYLDPNQPGPASDIAARGQRIVTFLVYLNADYEGGETDFPAIGLRHRGGQGGALYFGNIDPASGVPDVRTLHAGLAPTRGEKWLLSQWIRDRPLS